MSPVTHSDKPQYSATERLVASSIAERFAEAVSRWIDTLPPGKNKLTIITLLVLFRRGELYPLSFVKCIGHCFRHIVNGYICTFIITGIAADNMARQFCVRFAIKISRGPATSSVSPFPQISGEREENRNTAVFNTSIQ